MFVRDVGLWFCSTPRLCVGFGIRIINTASEKRAGSVPSFLICLEEPGQHWCYSFPKCSMGFTSKDESGPRALFVGGFKFVFSFFNIKSFPNYFSLSEL